MQVIATSLDEIIRHLAEQNLLSEADVRLDLDRLAAGESAQHLKASPPDSDEALLLTTALKFWRGASHVELKPSKNAIQQALQVGSGAVGDSQSGGGIGFLLQRMLVPDSELIPPKPSNEGNELTLDEGHFSLFDDKLKLDSFWKSPKSSQLRQGLVAAYKGRQGDILSLAQSSGVRCGRIDWQQGTRVVLYSALREANNDPDNPQGAKKFLSALVTHARSGFSELSPKKELPLDKLKAIRANLDTNSTSLSAVAPLLHCLADFYAGKEDAIIAQAGGRSNVDLSSLNGGGHGSAKAKLFSLCAGSRIPSETKVSFIDALIVHIENGYPDLPAAQHDFLTVRQTITEAKTAGSKGLSVAKQLSRIYVGNEEKLRLYLRKEGVEPSRLQGSSLTAFLFSLRSRDRTAFPAIAEALLTYAEEGFKEVTQFTMRPPSTDTAESSFEKEMQDWIAKKYVTNPLAFEVLVKELAIDTMLISTGGSFFSRVKAVFNQAKAQGVDSALYTATVNDRLLD